VSSAACMVRNGDRRSIGNSASLQVRSFLLKWQYFTNCRNIILSVATGHHNHTPAPQNKETASSSFANCASLEASYPNFFILTDPLVQRGGCFGSLHYQFSPLRKSAGSSSRPDGAISSVYHHSWARRSGSQVKVLLRSVRFGDSLPFPRFE
jgi:hypothetical protein